MLRFAQHDNRGVITGHAERSKAESKHLSAPMPNVQWITVVYLANSQETLEQFFVPKPNLVMGILKKLQTRVRQQLSKFARLANSA